MICSTSRTTRPACRRCRCLSTSQCRSRRTAR
jgi:hypothetical protein